MGRPVAHPGRVRIAAYDVVRIVLGLVLLTAAALKGHQLATEPVAGTGLLTSRWFLIGVVEFELFFGLWLWFGLYPRRTWQLALLCFSTFGCVSLYKALSGEATCGCFGRVPVNPWYTLVLDLAAVATLLGFRPASVAESSPRPVAGEGPGVRARTGTRLGWVLAILLLPGIAAALATASYQAATLDESGAVLGDGEFQVLEPEKRIGKRFPLLDYIDVGNRLAEGEWVVLFFRHGCPKCLQEIARYEALARCSVTDRTLPQASLIEVPPYGDAKALGLLLGAPCALGRLSHENEWFVETPAVFQIRDQIVQSNWIGREQSRIGERAGAAESGTASEKLRSTALDEQAYESGSGMIRSSHVRCKGH